MHDVEIEGEDLLRQWGARIANFRQVGEMLNKLGHMYPDGMTIEQFCEWEYVSFTNNLYK